MLDSLTQLLQAYNIVAQDVIPLPASGGDRQYYRLHTNAGTLIATYSTSIAETKTFLAFSKTFTDLQLPVPKIIAVNDAYDWYLQSDVGKDCLLDVVLQHGITEAVVNLYQQAIMALPKFQILAHPNINYELCLASKQFDAAAALFDLNYYANYYLNQLHIKYDAAALQKEFVEISNTIGAITPQYFMYRDLQGRNIMVLDGELTFIDYQGGMQGPLQYDVASLLWQAKAQLPASLKLELLELFYTQANVLCNGTLDKEIFFNDYYKIVLMRLLQVLGAYGRRGLQEGKQHFIDSIPSGLQNIREWMQLQDVSITYPTLHNTLVQITNK